MLTQQEIMNNAFKELLYQEQMLANKFAELQKEMTDPQLQKVYQGMEMASRTRQSMLSEKMRGYGIV
ncbi:hypothetical protein [Halobacillus mangrovi]|uniref:Uncharacterized protein n=2 Tax=Halobacillus mangrovi TaxID=402384 RepID=A0A1W5ZZE4_9BACI|nr:hypothetical protein [Halobacillus mangrovi]ARI78663.1 hypothetical protein HM131_18260 [Halobacillus mangrovi]